MIDREILKNCKTDSEKETAIFFSDLGLDCINLNFDVKDEFDNKITDIDGIFLDKKNEAIIIYDDSTQKDPNQKIIAFFSKCIDDKYEKQIYDSHSNLPNYPIYILYIDKSRNSFDANTSSVNHVYRKNTKILFNDDFQYFKTLITKIGSWAKNDLYNFLDIFPPNHRIEINAIKYYIGDTAAYMFSDKPHNVLNYSYISRRRDNDEGYQRMVKSDKINDIDKKIQNKLLNGFCNSIILNSTIEIIENERISRSRCPAPVKINLPNHYSSCRVVDGQHRLLGLSKLNEIEQTKFSIPIVLLNNLSIEEEKKIFLEVNSNADSVDRNLEFDLISTISSWDEIKQEDKFYIKEISILIKKLNDLSILKDKIFYGKSDDSKKDTITLISFVDSLQRSNAISNVGGKFQKKVKDFETPYSILKKLIIESNKSINNKDYIFSNRGIDLLCEIFSYVFISKAVEDYETVIDDIFPAFSVLVNDNFEKLSKMYGYQGYRNAYNLIVKLLENEFHLNNVDCKKNHTKVDDIVEKLNLDQSGTGRHKCASCAYDEGYKDGINGSEKRDMDEVNSLLPYSQQGKRRHKSTKQAYEFGYEEGLKNKR